MRLIAADLFLTRSIACYGVLLGLWSGTFVVSLETALVSRSDEEDVNALATPALESGMKTSIPILVAMEFSIMLLYLGCYFRLLSCPRSTDGILDFMLPILNTSPRNKVKHIDIDRNCHSSKDSFIDIDITSAHNKPSRRISHGCVL